MSRGNFVKCDQCLKLVEAWESRLWAKLELPVFEDSDDNDLYLKSFDSCSFECTRRIIEYSEDQGRKYMFYRKSKELKNTIIEEIDQVYEKPFSTESEAEYFLQKVIEKYTTISNGLELEKQPKEVVEPYKQYYRIYYEAYLDSEDRFSFPVLFELRMNEVRISTTARKETI